MLSARQVALAPLLAALAAESAGGPTQVPLEHDAFDFDAWLAALDADGATAAVEALPTEAPPALWQAHPCSLSLDCAALGRLAELSRLTRLDLTTSPFAVGAALEHIRQLVGLLELERCSC